MSENIGFVGFGNMGRAMAETLLQAGYGLRVTQANTQDEASVREVIQPDDLAGELPGEPGRQRCHRCSQIHPLRAQRHGCQREPGIVGLTLCAPIDDVIFQEHPFPARLLGNVRILNQLFNITFDI